MGLFDGTPFERPVTPDAGDRDPAAGGDAAGTPPAEQHPRVRREKRRGKWSAVVAGLDPDPASLKALAKTLRTELGCGGGVTDGELILQGDHRDAVVAKLIELGYRAKPAGG